MHDGAFGPANLVPILVIKILHDFIRLLMILNTGCAVIAFATAAHHQMLIVWDRMATRDLPWWREVYTPALSEEASARRGQPRTLLLSFFVNLTMQALLTWLYELTSRSMDVC